MIKIHAAERKLPPAIHARLHLEHPKAGSSLCLILRVGLQRPLRLIYQRTFAVNIVVPLVVTTLFAQFRARNLPFATSSALRSTLCTLLFQVRIAIQEF